MSKHTPSLVIMAAGMGSRFGGLKQIESVDPEGHIIIDFSLFDAWRAGFRDVVFIIKREMEEEFRECIGDRTICFVDGVGIDLRTAVHFGKPSKEFGVLARRFGGEDKCFPISRWMSELRSLCLPRR